MSLVACVNAYAEAWTIERCLVSIRRACPQGVRIVVVDGAYAQFPHPDGAESIDGTIEIAERLADEVVRCPSGKEWASEIAKRNAYLRLGRDGETMLVVDADEEVCGFVPSEIPAPEMDIRFERDDGTPPAQYLRLFRWRPGLRYEGTHHALWDGGRLTNETPRPVAAGCWVVHHYDDRGKRDARRLKAKAEYYRWLGKDENAFRGAHTLV